MLRTPAHGAVMALTNSSNCCVLRGYAQAAGRNRPRELTRPRALPRPPDDRMRAWCLGPMCWHEARLTFDELTLYGATDRTKMWDIEGRLRCTRCSARNADTQ